MEGPAPEIASALKDVAGVTEVRITAEQDGRSRFEIGSEMRQDVRRDLARTIVNKGWGLLELQSATMSLEDIFIKLTTAEEAAATSGNES